MVQTVHRRCFASYTAGSALSVCSELMQKGHTKPSCRQVLDTNLSISTLLGFTVKATKAFTDVVSIWTAPVKLMSTSSGCRCSTHSKRTRAVCHTGVCSVPDCCLLSMKLSVEQEAFKARCSVR